MTLPFVMPDPFNFQRRVFAHYFYSFPLSVNNQPAINDYYNLQWLLPSGEAGKYATNGGYLRARPLPVPVQATFSAIVNMELEVQMAIARGITGFTFDILNLADALSSTGHLTNLLVASLAVETRFKIVPMLDMNALIGLTQAQAVQLIASFTHPSFMRTSDGRILFSAYNATFQPLAFWKGVIATLNSLGVDVAFIPVLLGSPTSSILDPISIGTGGWGTATPAVALSTASYMTPVLPQQFRPKDNIFWEASNFDTFRNGWQSAINGAIAGTTPYVQAITWSDFSEGGQIQPYTDATLALNIGTGFYDLTAYYATWFMSGNAPKITKDVLYWCYRRMPSTVTHLNQANNFSVVAPPAEVSNIEMLAFLTDPGDLVINGKIMSAPGGITSFKIPSVPGNPTMALQRNGSNVQQGVCPITICGPTGDTAGTLDMTYWSGNT